MRTGLLDKLTISSGILLTAASTLLMADSARRADNMPKDANYSNPTNSLDNLRNERKIKAEAYGSAIGFTIGIPLIMYSLLYKKIKDKRLSGE